MRAGSGEPQWNLLANDVSTRWNVLKTIFSRGVGRCIHQSVVVQIQLNPDTINPGLARISYAVAVEVLEHLTAKHHRTEVTEIQVNNHITAYHRHFMYVRLKWERLYQIWW